MVSTGAAHPAQCARRIGVATAAAMINVCAALVHTCAAGRLERVAAMFEAGADV